MLCYVLLEQMHDFLCSSLRMPNGFWFFTFHLLPSHLATTKFLFPSFSKYNNRQNRVFYNKHISVPARILRCLMHGVWLDWAHINNRTHAYDEQQKSTCGMNLLHNPLYSHAYFSSYYSTFINVCNEMFSWPTSIQIKPYQFSFRI